MTESIVQTKFRYNDSVRRLISIALLLLFSFPLISPVLALVASSESNVPACCRRNGTHRCYLSMRPAAPSRGAQLSTIPQHCPSYPAVVTTLRHHNLSLPTASLIFAEILSHPALRLQTQARARVALDRSRSERGPPSFILF